MTTGPQTDLAIVGAGVVGLAVAREMLNRRPGLQIEVFDRAAAVATEQTGHNSGVIHAGIYYKPGSLKARLCSEGARDMYAFCERHDIPHDRCGKVIVARGADEVAGLDELERRGVANGVAGLRRLSGSELERVEPAARGVAALHSPATGIVDFGVVARKMAQLARTDGVTITTGCEVERVTRHDRGVAVHHADGRRIARHAVVCAGARTDRLAVAAGASPDPRIVPFRGGYLRLRPAARHLVRGLIYPVPDPELPFLGVHLTRTIDGDVLLGPTALMVAALDAYSVRRVRPRDLARTLAWPGAWRVMARFWRTGLRELSMAVGHRRLVAACAEYVPGLTTDAVAAGPAGVRAQAIGRDGALVDDFVFHDADGALYVRNAPSPAATSALAIARRIADRVEAQLR